MYHGEKINKGAGMCIYIYIYGFWQIFKTKYNTNINKRLYTFSTCFIFLNKTKIYSYIHMYICMYRTIFQCLKSNDIKILDKLLFYIKNVR